jgi:hypothetical protein
MKFLMATHPGWSFYLLGPSDVLEMARRYFPAVDAELLIKALSVANCHWIQRVDMARFIALYALGGLYLDLDVRIHANLDAILEASSLMTRGSSKSHIELDAVAAHPGDSRILQLLRTQAENVLKKRGSGICPDASVSAVTGVRLITSWCKAHKLTAKPLANRFIVAKGRGTCKAILKTYNNQTWACTIQVRQPFFEVHHAASWCRAGQGLKRFAFKATIKDTSVLGLLKGWNAQKKQNAPNVNKQDFHPTISIPPVMNMIKKKR